MTDSGGAPSEGLPSAGPERVIFLRALQQFSDDCEPPELQPMCLSPLILLMEAEVALRNAWISSLNMAIRILGVWESISETELCGATTTATVPSTAWTGGWKQTI
jgi:hypothetical protein